MSENVNSTTGPSLPASEGADIPWVKCSDDLPPDKMEVETKVDDGRGVRNVTSLLRCNGLWRFPGTSMYVYYMPTHWRILPPNDKLRD